MSENFCNIHPVKVFRKGIFFICVLCTFSCARASLKFAVISDLNGRYGSTTYGEDTHKSIAFIRSKKVDLVLSTGDMVAGQKKGLNYQKMWLGFHKAVTTPLLRSKIPFAPSPGNHDASAYSGFERERREYKKTFSSRRPSFLLNSHGEKLDGKLSLVPGSNYPFYYGFILSNALFMAIDATKVGALSENQVAWIENTLANYQNIPFKIMFGHMPMFPYAYNRASDYIGRNNASGVKDMERLMDKYEVDLFLSGHHHAYYPGTRKKHTRFISTPLLGGGPRKLLGGFGQSSPKGFIIFEVKDNELKMTTYNSSDLTPINTKSLPTRIRIPSKSSKSCKSCGYFPKSLFVPGSDRAVYYRVDRH